MRKRCAFTCLFVLALFIHLDWKGVQGDSVSKDEDLKFTDVQAQTKEFISYYKSIQLTPEQEKIKKEALSAIPAPCCTDFPMATCCCPCNLAKAVWGLSNYLIVKKNYDAPKLKETVNAWIQFTHPNGFKGDSCHQNRCATPMSEDGCSGMGEEVIF
jgi:hypothetical protein